MKARRVKAWACSACKKPRRTKEVAEACCTCRECGVNASAYVGTSRAMCQECAASRELHNALENLEHAKARLNKAQSGHVR